MDSRLVNAIRKRGILKLKYHGYSRTVEPHAYGLDSSGDALLLCYQTSGKRYEPEQTGWRCLKLYEAVCVIETAETFAQPASGYVRNSPLFHTIIAQI